MKITNNSFLFLFLYILAIIYSSQNKIFAQMDTDSSQFFMNKALNPQDSQDLIEAYKFFSLSYENSISLKNDYSTINSLYYLASIEYKKGDYDDSEEWAVKAIEILDRIKVSDYSKSTKKSFYNLLGLIYTERRNKVKAIELYNKSLNIAESAADSAIIFNNISLIHNLHNDSILALKELNKANKLIPRINDSLTKALIIDNLGVITSKFNKNDGLRLLEESLWLRQSIGDTSKIYTSYSHLAEYYNSIGNKILSKEYALQAYKLANVINSAVYKDDALGLLVDAGDDEYAIAYKRISDSLFSAEKISSNKFALMKYDFSEYKRKALESELEKEKEKFLKFVLLTIVAILVLGSVFLYFLLRSKHKKDTIKQVYNTESRISKRVHDEVANDMFNFFTKLQTQTNLEGKFYNELEGIYNKTRDISKEYALLETDDFFEDIISDLVHGFNTENTNIILKGVSEIKWDLMGELRKATLYKVLQELLINMKKHSEATVVLLLFKNEGKRITLNYSDNGIGCELTKGVGLQNVENRITSIKGTFNFDSELAKGFKAKITV